jgi:hypothetical protein
MTNTELLNKIRQEIERQKDLMETADTAYSRARIDEANDILSFLSKLSEEIGEVEPCEELDEEIKKVMVKLPFFIRGKDLIAFARHFAEWGRKQVLQEIADGKIHPVDKITAAWLNDE